MEYKGKQVIKGNNGKTIFTFTCLWDTRNNIEKKAA